MSNPKEIFLQPECCACPDTGRLWCEHDAPQDCDDDVPWTRYVLADQAPGVPEGYVLVPVEPTDAMRAAAYKEVDEAVIGNYGGPADPMDIWYAMVEAAQPGGAEHSEQESTT